MEQIVQILTCDDCAAHGQSAALGFVKRTGVTMQAWAMEPGQRILKTHGYGQQVADCLTAPRGGHRKALGL